MNKAELVGSLLKNKKAGFESKASAERSVDAVLEGIIQGLKKDQKVQLIGFGTFAIRNRKARTGRNPQTGEQIKIKASKSVGFKCGKSLKNEL